ncbi:MAG: hypothetical protein EXR65_01010 [Dehalococcoidia bacterium]|nr:hypothetical protein [Dehalococcoidia bacterium]
MDDLPRRGSRRMRRIAPAHRTDDERPRNPWPAIALFGIVVLGGLIGIGACVAAFVSSVPHRTLEVPLSDLMPGAPRFYPRISFGADAAGNTLGVWLVRRGGGGVLALYSRDPLSGCHVPWRTDTSFGGVSPVFRAECSGSAWDAEGARLSGPAPRGLDRFDATVAETTASVDLERLQLGPCPPGVAGPAECSQPGAPQYRELPAAPVLPGRRP